MVTEDKIWSPRTCFVQTNAADNTKHTQIEGELLTEVPIVNDSSFRNDERHLLLNTLRINGFKISPLKVELPANVASLKKVWLGIVWHATTAVAIYILNISD